jgi:excisionase family DNA binding protein
MDSSGGIRTLFTGLTHRFVKQEAPMPGKRRRPPRKMTVEEAEAALLATRKAAAHKALQKDLAVSVPIAAVLLGLSKNHVYDCIREGTFPIPTIKIGRTFRIPTRALREKLQLQDSSSSETA